MKEKKKLEALREEANRLIDSLTPEQQDRLLRSWEVTQKINREHPHKGYYTVIVQ